jgi:hypothetical protein
VSFAAREFPHVLYLHEPLKIQALPLTSLTQLASNVIEVHELNVSQPPFNLAIQLFLGK